MTIIQIPEIINEQRAKFILSLDEQERTDLIWKDTERQLNKGEYFCDKKIYVNQVVKYLKLQLENNCELSIPYNYSKKMMKDGRLYAKFGLQSMKKNLRGFLIGDDEKGHYYNDYDMKNCHLKILRQMMIDHIFSGNKKKFVDEFPYISAYTVNDNGRRMLLEKGQCDKQDILTMMNSNTYTEINTIPAKKIDCEFKKVQSLFYDHTPETLEDKYGHFKQDKEKNKKCKFLNRLLCIKENKLINKVVSYFNNEYEVSPVSSIIFDGLHIKSDLPNQVDKLNEITKEDGVEWAIKDFDDSIEKSKVYEDRDGLPAYERLDYDTVKREFEKDHFMIKSPYCFMEEDTIDDKKIVRAYNENAFKGIVKPWQYEKFTGKGLERISILNTWIADKKRRVYKKLDFIPKFINSKEIYNTFQGFDFSCYNEVNFKYSTELIDMFRKQISILCDHEEETVEWVMKFFADIFQNPDRLPAVALVMKSGQGWGKDRVIDCISKLLGSQYVHRTAKTEEVFGQFNSAIKNKILLQLNELEGKDGFANKEKLKNLITENETSINQKNLQEYVQSNFVRIVICSNNSTPIEIPAGDRRFVVTQASTMKPSTEHFNTLSKLMEDESELFSLYQFFMGYDLGDISLRNCRPKTQAYKEMQTNTIHPFYYWLNDALMDYKEEFADNFKINKKNGSLLVTGNILFQKFREHMDLSSQPLKNFTQSRTMKDYLGKFNVYNKKTKYMGSAVWYYWINVSETLKCLDSMGINEGVIELDDDDI